MTDSLEYLAGEEELNKGKAKPFGIAAGIPYSRDTFVKDAGDLFDLEEGYQKFRKDSKDTDALEDIVKVISKYFTGGRTNSSQMFMENPAQALDFANSALSRGYVSMAGFVANQREELLDKLSAKQLYSLFARVPLYKSGEKERDRIKDLRDKVFQMQRANEEGKDIGSAVQDEVQELIESLPDEQKMFVNKNHQIALPYLTNYVARSIQKAFSSLFKDKEGKLDKKAIINYITENYTVAEKFIDTLPDDEKADYWDDNLKPQYVEIARELYGAEKKAYKLEKNPEKEARKARAKEVGLRS